MTSTFRDTRSWKYQNFNEIKMKNKLKQSIIIIITIIIKTFMRFTD